MTNRDLISELAELPLGTEVKVACPVYSKNGDIELNDKILIKTVRLDEHTNSIILSP